MYAMCGFISLYVRISAFVQQVYTTSLMFDFDLVTALHHVRSSIQPCDGLVEHRSVAVHNDLRISAVLRCER